MGSPQGGKPTCLPETEDWRIPRFLRKAGKTTASQREGAALALPGPVPYRRMETLIAHQGGRGWALRRPSRREGMRSREALAVRRRSCPGCQQWDSSEGSGELSKETVPQGSDYIQFLPKEKGKVGPPGNSG